MINDVLNKKRLGLELSYVEIRDFFNGFLAGSVEDYQMSSLLMAICINGMSEEEVFALTKVFIDSGDILEWDNISGIKVDKHSTGGVGDKTTLIVGPIVAACGVPVVKMSGRGLGYTGGTIDKLESIPGYRVDLNEEEILSQVKNIGIVITSQTADLAPMDKMVYALRDVSGTVSSIPLIASSIMSKKIASGADKIIIDIKFGRGALLPNINAARKLSPLLKKIGKIYNREVKTIISPMDIPLGHNIGNSLEVMEAMDVLQGKEVNNSLVDLCYDLATEMISMGLNISKKEAMDMVYKVIENGEAYQKFLDLIKAQGGKIEKLQVSGIIKDINAINVAKLSMSLGAGRENEDDLINYDVGVRLEKLYGDHVKKGDILATLYLPSAKKIKVEDNIFVIN